jgi:aminopeptidase N
MENTTCTTLTTRILPDEKIVRDSNTYDYVIVHELAHQWFGDLVTCRDWQHIWLNEAFASYSEALYYQHVFGDDEFYTYMLDKMDEYLNADVNVAHKIPLVTRRYDTPLQMFNPPRTYQKGAWIVHMLRCLLGNEDFKKSLTVYLDSFKYKTAETEDLRKIFEQNSGQSLQKFFDQWVYQPGHPEINAIFSTDNSAVNLKIEQTQASEFEFPLEILIVLQINNGTEKKIQDTIFITNKETEKTYNIPSGAVIKRLAIDPYLKILKKINITIPDTNNSILINSLLNGDSTIEKIYAARALKDKQSNELIDHLRKVILHSDVSWNIRAEAAKTLGSIKSDASYQALKDCLNMIQNSKIKESIVRALGTFSKINSFDLLKPILENEDESTFVQHAAAIAIAQSKNEEKALPILVRLLEKKSYKDIVARGAIEGLKIIAIESADREKIYNIESMLIEKTKIQNEGGIRQAATSALGYIGRYHKERTNIVRHLKHLLNDDSIHIRNTAFASLGNVFEYSKDQQMSQDLNQKKIDETNDFVRETAEKSISLINENAPASQDLLLEKSLLKDKHYKTREIEQMEKCIALY